MERPTPRARHSFAWRFTVPFLMDDGFWNAVSLLCGAFLAVRHVAVGTRPHYHVAIANGIHTQDTMRKHLKKLVLDQYSQHIAIQQARDIYADDPSWDGLRDIPEGQSLMSLKKWDTSSTLLVYMLKGSLPESANHSNEQGGGWLDQAYLNMLRETWVSKNPQENWYRGWMVSEQFPKPRIYTDEERMDAVMTGRKLPTIPFDTIINHARAYVQVTEGTDYVNSKQRYVIKDLISNYCQRHNIKMCPVYI